jgi:hypothetical protein
MRRLAAGVVLAIALGMFVVVWLTMPEGVW